VPPARWITAVTAVWAALLAMWLVLTPAYSGFDEAQHVDMVTVVLDGTHSWPAPGERYVRAELVPQAARAGALIGDPAARAAVPVPGAGRPGFAISGTASTLLNQQMQHPPTYYVLMAALPSLQSWHRLSTGQLDLEIRMVGALPLVALPLLCWLVAAQLTGLVGGNGSEVRRVSGVVALGPLLVPGVVRSTAVVNNDGLLVVVAALAMWLLLRLLGGAAGRVPVGAAGLSVGAAWLLKGTGVAVVATLAVSVLIGPVLVRARVAAAFGVALLTSAPWWGRNLVRFGTPQPRGFGAARAAVVHAQAGRPLSLPRWLVEFPRVTVLTGWSHVTPFAPHLGEAAAVALTALLILGLRGRGVRFRAIALIPAAGALMLALAESWDSWRLYGTLAAAQGRYMFVGLAGASAVVASGVQHAWPRKLPPQATLLTLALALQASSAVQAAG